MARGQYNGIVSVEATTDMLRVRDALEQYGPTAKARFHDAATSQLRGAWTDELSKRNGISSQQADIVKAFPLVAVADYAVVASVGGIGPLGFLTRQMEFGADREAYKPARYPRRKSYSGMKQGPANISRNGTYLRRTRRQLPSISARGWIAYPSAGAWSERVYKMMLQILVKVGHDAFEGKTR